LSAVATACQWEGPINSGRGNIRRTPAAEVATAGVTHTKLAVETQLRWLFREQPTEDYGIDAHVEVVEEEEVRGRLLALQIKSGKSFFRDAGPGGWWFRPSTEHAKYWLNHSLPVVAVLFNPATARCYWQLVNRQTLEESSKGGWKVLVPETQLLDASATGPLSQAAEGDPYVLRLRELLLAKPWMALLESGKRLVVDIEEWINKHSGRGSISVGVDNEDGGAIEELSVWGVFRGSASYAELLPQLFAWADVHVHEATYEDAEYDQYLADCTYVDREGDRIVTENLEGWQMRRSIRELRPYVREGDEVDRWRLELTLNELGKAFLLVDRFGSTGQRLLT
jgi:Domain of unknown function (DUF4365)